jgi:initiation factor 1A
MPNQKGGKNYKKSKHSTPMKAQLFLPEQDQIFGRVIRNLGQRRMLVFSNDNKIRMCHIRGSMRRGSSWISVGDIVLITRRDFEKLPESPGEYENADIISRYDKDLTSDLKKVPGINPKLFIQIESVDQKLLAEICSKKFDDLQEKDDDAGIEFAESSEEEEDDENETEESKNEKKEKGKRGWKADRSKQEGKQIDSETHERDNDDFNIDDI